MIAIKADRTRRWPIIVVVAVLFLAGLVARSLFRLPITHPDPNYISPYIGIATGQLILLGIWCGMGNAFVLWRLLSSSLGLFVVWFVTFYDLLGRWLYSPREVEVLIAFCTLMMPVAVTGCVFGVVQAFHSRLKVISDIPPDCKGTLQFGLRHMFIATTVAAVLFMGATAVRSFYTANRQSEAMEIPRMFGSRFARDAILTWLN